MSALPKNQYPYAVADILDYLYVDEEEIRDEIDSQNTYKNIFAQRDPLLEEFEQLDTTLKKIAFDPKDAKSICTASNNYAFISLKIGSTTQEIFYENKILTPKQLTSSIAKALANDKLSVLLEKYKALNPSEDEKYNYYNVLLNMAYMFIAPRATLDAETQELSVFNNKNEAIRELLVFLSKELNTMGKEKAQELHNAPIKEHYLKALYALIVHATLENPNYKLPTKKTNSIKEFIDGMVRDDKGREANVKAFLQKFAQKVPKQETKTDNLLDNNFDKSLKIKTKSEELYATLKQIDGVSSYLDKADDTMTQVQEQNASGRGTDLSTPFDDFRTSLPYKTLLSSIKVLSFFMTVGKVVEYTQGKEKLKIHNLIGVTGDTLSITHTLADVLKISHDGIPKNVEELVKLNKFIPAETFKVMARFGIIGAVANAINDASSINEKTNDDFYITTNTKNSLIILLMLAPAWWALGGIATVELVWYFLKDKIENSKLELYLYDSLLFNTTEHNDSRFFNTLQGEKYKASLFVQTLKNSNTDYEIANFTTANRLREFIAQLQESNPKLIEAAMHNELSRLKSTLYDMDITINEDKQVKTLTNNSYDIYHVYPYVNIPKHLGDNVKNFILIINDVVVAKNRGFDVDSEGSLFNTLPSNDLTGIEVLTHSQVNILIQTKDNIYLKYKLIYEYREVPYGTMKATPTQEMIILKDLRIKKIETVALSQEDYTILGA